MLLYFSESELAELLKKAYAKGCYGFMDLKDATAEGMVDDIIAEKSKESFRSEQYDAIKSSKDSYIITGGNSYISPIRVSSGNDTQGTTMQTSSGHTMTLTEQDVYEVMEEQQRQSYLVEQVRPDV